jgi:hypothetical protein
VLNPSAGVQPRLPSVFEPNVTADTDAVSPTLTVATGHHSIHRQTATPTRSEDAPRVSAQRVRAQIDNARPPAPSDEWSDGEDRIDSPIARMTTPAVVNVHGELSPPARLRDVVLPDHSDDGAEPSAMTTPIASSSARASIVREAIGPTRSTDSSDPHARATATDTSPWTRLNARGPELEPPASRPRVVAAQSPSRPARMAQSQADSPLGDSDAERTVHVTIGRVEIRAASASPTMRAPAPSSSAMTLNEYLRQRRTSGER